MNIFFIGMGYMGAERLKAAINLKKKNKINILGFYDPNVQKIKLQKQTEPIIFPSTLNLKNHKIKVFKPDFDVFWHIVDEKV